MIVPSRSLFTIFCTDDCVGGRFQFAFCGWWEVKLVLGARDCTYLRVNPYRTRAIPTTQKAILG